MDAARAVMGQGWPFVCGPHPVAPLERRWSERTPAKPGPDGGAGGFGYFCQDKSDSPGRAKSTRQRGRIGTPATRKQCADDVLDAGSGLGTAWRAARFASEAALRQHVAWVERLQPNETFGFIPAITSETSP